MRKSTEERFWAKVRKTDGCWEWIAGKSTNGYGLFHNGKLIRAHRFSYELVNGPIPDGIVVDHICHNRACVRPNHLRLATRKQNVEYRAGVSSRKVSNSVRNVYPHGNRWRVVLGHEGKLVRFGVYSTIAEAEQVAIRARADLFTFPDFDMRGA